MYLIQNADTSFLTGLGKKQFETLKQNENISQFLQNFFLIFIHFNSGHFKKITDKAWWNDMAQFKIIYCLKFNRPIKERFWLGLGLRLGFRLRLY